MKYYRVLFVTLAGIFLIPNTSRAQASDVKRELLLDLKEEATKCVVEIVKNSSGKSEVLGYESSCTTFKIVSNSLAQVYIDGQWYNIEIKESAASDGGDLDDMYVTNSTGKLVAQKSNVAAYDSVIAAIVGADNDLKRREP